MRTDQPAQLGGLSAAACGVSAEPIVAAPDGRATTGSQGPGNGADPFGGGGVPHRPLRLDRRLEPSGRAADRHPGERGRGAAVLGRDRGSGRRRRAPLPPRVLGGAARAGGVAGAEPHRERAGAPGDETARRLDSSSSTATAQTTRSSSTRSTRPPARRSSSRSTRSRPDEAPAPDSLPARRGRARTPDRGPAPAVRDDGPQSHPGDPHRARGRLAARGGRAGAHVHARRRRPGRPDARRLRAAAGDAAHLGHRPVQLPLRLLHAEGRLRQRPRVPRAPGAVDARGDRAGRRCVRRARRAHSPA